MTPVVLLSAVVGAADSDAVRRKLDAALASGDAAAVRAAVADGRAALGDQAGVPELPDRYAPIPAGGTGLTPAEAKAAFGPACDHIEKLRWWKPGLDPTQLRHALREPAAVASGCAAAVRAKLDHSDRALKLGREAGDFLLWAQEQAGTGGFPFPTVRGVTSDNAFVAADRYLSRAEKAGRHDKVVRNGWAIDDEGDGGLQFDTGECGVALFDLYAATNDKKYLNGAVRAADWAAARPLVRNWNYNSFSVHLLAAAFEATGDKKYLAAATTKAVVGVIPGQLPDGPRAGRWLDGHNARTVYHYIMLRGLARLAGALPADDPARPAVVNCLKVGLTAANREIVAKGAANPNKQIEALIFVRRAFASDPDFLRDTATTGALDGLGKLASEAYRAGKPALAPREWGLFLDSAFRRPDPMNPAAAK